MWIAIEFDRVEKVRAMLGQGVDPNMKGVHGTLLSYAAGLGRARIVRVLLDGRADVNRASPLIAALDKPEIVALLLDRGADPNISVDGEAVLARAAGEGYAQTVSLLIQHGARVREQAGEAALRRAWQEDRADAVKVLEAAGVPQPKAANLFDALAFPSPMRELIGQGADPNQRDPDGRTPLIAATAERNLGAVRFLLEHGANPDAKDGEGKSALAHLGDWMCGCGESSYLTEARVAALLLAKGAHVPAMSHEELQSALQRAVIESGLESVRALASSGADVNAEDQYRSTPLGYAAGAGNVEVVRILLEHGADPNRGGRGRPSPLATANAKGYWKVAELLVEAGAR